MSKFGLTGVSLVELETIPLLLGYPVTNPSSACKIHTMCCQIYPRQEHVAWVGQLDERADHGLHGSSTYLK